MDGVSLTKRYTLFKRTQQLYIYLILLSIVFIILIVKYVQNIEPPITINNNLLLVTRNDYFTNESQQKFLTKLDLSGNYFAYLDGYLKNKSQLINNANCQIPELQIPMESNLSIEGILKCNEINFELSYLKRDRIAFNITLLQHMGFNDGDVSCCYKKIDRYKSNSSTQRDSISYADNLVRISKACHNISLTKATSPHTSFIKIICKAKTDISKYSETIYENYHAVPLLPGDNKDLQRKLLFWKNFSITTRIGIAKQKGKVRENETSSNQFNVPPNVLLLGLDSTSRMNFKRLMNQTNFALKKLGAIDMMAYNKVGENTFPNFVPLMSSYSIDEIRPLCYLTRWDPQDDCPYIWKNFSSQNYLTAHFEDAPNIAIFNYGKTGFLNSPVDIYLRPFMIAYYKEMLSKKERLCSLKRPEEIIMNYIVELARMSGRYKIPYFVTSWLSDLSHSSTSDLHLLDNLIARTLKLLFEEGLLKNTLLLLMSDHGYRFKSVRRTAFGWYEDKLPVLWILPPNSYPNWREMIFNNSRKLITPFDVHETLRDILYINKSGSGFKVSKLPKKEFQRSHTPHGISLFTAIPDRSCAEASIPLQFCTCKSPSSYSENITVIQMATEAIIKHVNKIIPSSCQPLGVKKVITSGVIRRSKDLKHSQHSSIRTVSEPFYADNFIIGLITVPGDFLLEAWVAFDKSMSTVIQVSNLARLNEIGGWNNTFRCLNDTTHEMIEYCFCK